MKRILIVEDDPMISEIYQKKFAEKNYEVIVAESGEQAVKLLKKEPADVMILDLIMPKMDGFEVLQNVRKILNNQDIKIIVFSNLSQKENQDKAFKLGANGFIVKADYTPSELVREVSRVLNQYQEIKRNEMIKLNRENGKTSEKSGMKKILLIEDEQIFLEMFGDKLRQDGFFVETASNGVWGLKKALKEKFDLFILDMVMPAMTGEEIIRSLKMDEKTKNVPIIVLSASVENEVEKKIKEMGVNEFFVKTQIIPSELSKKAGELIR